MPLCQATLALDNRVIEKFMKLLFTIDETKIPLYDPEKSVEPKMGVANVTELPKKERTEFREP